MALSFRAVEKAYEVLNELHNTVHPQLEIFSFPEDLDQLNDRDEIKEHVKPDWLYGFDKKSDGGWENLVFWTKDPSSELKEAFDRLKKNVPNSSISRYDEFMRMWKFGWF